MKVLQVLFVFLMAFASLALFMVFVYNWNIIAAMGSGVMAWLISEYLKIQDAAPVPPKEGKVIAMYPEAVALLDAPTVMEKLKSDLSNLINPAKNSKQLVPPAK